jgi:hypothetical protein
MRASANGPFFVWISGSTQGRDRTSPDGLRMWKSRQTMPVGDRGLPLRQAKHFSSPARISPLPRQNAAVDVPTDAYRSQRVAPSSIAERKMEDRSTKMKRRLLMAIFCQLEGDEKGAQVLTSSVSSKRSKSGPSKQGRIPQSFH